MPSSNLPEHELLKTVLKPLLEDFQYWFARSCSLLETESIPFLSVQQQSALLARLKQAQAEVSTTQMLFEATGGQVGVEASTLRPWHQLVTECWQIALRFRTEQSTTQLDGE